MTAYLSPGMQEFVDELRAANAPHPQTLPLAVVRQNMEDQAVRWNAFPVEGVTHSDGTIAGLAVRVYRPADALAEHAMVYLHGGGWTAGSITTHDNMVRRLAAAEWHGGGVGQLPAGARAPGTCCRGRHAGRAGRVDPGRCRPAVRHGKAVPGRRFGRRQCRAGRAGGAEGPRRPAAVRGAAAVRLLRAGVRHLEQPAVWQW